MTNKILKEIVDWMIAVGTEETESGAYIIYYNEITRKFPTVTEIELRENHEDIKAEIDCRKEVLSETWDEVNGGVIYGFNMNFCGNYCGKNYKENGIFE